MTSDKFRDAIDLHFIKGHLQVKDKESLNIILRDMEFYNTNVDLKKDEHGKVIRPYTNKEREERLKKRDLQGQALLNYAWDRLKSKGMVRAEPSEGKVEEIRMRKGRRRRNRPMVIQRSIHDVITPKGFKAMQIRDKKTGRIIGWA
jgi:hypothetical protein